MKVHEILEVLALATCIALAQNTLEELDGQEE